MSAGRLPGLDRLRVALIGGVVVFHATRPFDPFDYYVKADAQLDALGPVVLFASLWGMPLFFVLAGLAAWHSLGRRGAAGFVRERVTRLLVPFAAGVVLLVPPQVHVERLQDGERVSYLDTLTGFFEVGWRWELPLPIEGQLFEPAHLWFLGYLFVFTLLLLPLMRALGAPVGARLLARVERRPAIWAAGLGLVAVAAEALLGAEDAGGWNRLAYPCFLLLGFVLAARTGLGARLGTRWRRLGAAGLLAFLAIVIAGMPLHERFGDALMTSGSLEVVAWRAAKAATGWLLVLAIAGAAIAGFAARRQARSPGPLAAYGHEAVLPVYLLHQTVAVVLAWWVLSWSLPAGLAWLALTLLTVAGTLVLYEGLRRPAPVRRLLGLRPRHPVPPRPERPGPSASYRFGLSRT